jgi:hypothetical protein
MDTPTPARHQRQHGVAPRQQILWPINNTARYRATDADCLAIGDLHLWSLLAVHDALTRVGVVATFRVLTIRRLARAVAACRYFELTALGELLSGVPDAAGCPRSAQAFDGEYRRRYSDGIALIRAAQHKLASAPEDFTATRA